jgi:hypothetical protein
MLCLEDKIPVISTPKANEKQAVVRTIPFDAWTDAGIMSREIEAQRKAIAKEPFGSVSVVSFKEISIKKLTF